MESEYVIAMKGGPHAGEAWSAILDRKLAELSTANVVFWGYNPTSCHPTKQVQPFASSAGCPIDVAMIPTGSDPGVHSAEAGCWSVDNKNWHPLPQGVRVTGSKWALIMDSLELCQETIDLARFVVGVGGQIGRPASEYLRYQTSKGCFRLIDPPWPMPAKHRVVARGRLVQPWAVFLR